MRTTTVIAPMLLDHQDLILLDHDATLKKALKSNDLPTEFWRVDGDRQGPSAVACGGTRQRHTHLKRHMKPCFSWACLLKLPPGAKFQTNISSILLPPS
jgi:hypothetical protein